MNRLLLILLSTNKKVKEHTVSSSWIFRALTESYFILIKEFRPLFQLDHDEPDLIRSNGLNRARVVF